MEVVGLLSELVLSSKETGTTTSPVKTFPGDQLVKYDASLSSYESACQKDPELKSFDCLLHERTNKLIRSVTGRRGKTGNPSLDTLMEICKYLGDLSQDVVKIIIESKEDLSKNKDLKSLVDLYFESTNKTLDLFKTVENCVKKAEIIHLIIQVAIKQFETESMDTDKKKKKNNYEETLKELNKVKAMGDPFGDEFGKQYQDVYKEQEMILDKIHEMQVMLEKKHKKLKKWKKLGKIVFMTVLLSLFATAMLSSPGVSMAVMGLITQQVTAGKCVIELLKEYEKALKTQIDLFRSMKQGTRDNFEATKTIKNLVESLITRISLILNTVDLAVEKREEEAVKLVMQKIITKVEGLADKIEEVGENVAKCSKVVVSGRVRVLEHTANLASPKAKC